MARHIVNVLDIGSANVKALISERRPDLPGIRILGAGLSKSEGVRKGAIIKPELVIESIKEAVRSAERTSGIPFRHAFLCFGSTALGFQKARARVAVSRADGEVTSHDIERVIKQARSSLVALQNKEILDSIGLGFNVDGVEAAKDPSGMKGENLDGEILFLTAQRKSLADLIDAVDKSGVAIDDVLVGPAGVSRSVLSPREREVGALVLDIGFDTSALGVFENGLPFSIAVFPFGSNHITNDIALGFQVSLDTAEKIKLGIEMPDSSQITRRKLQNIVEARLEDMFELVETHLKKISRSGLLPGGAALAGGGSRLEGIADFAKNSLRLPARLGRNSVLETNHKIADPIWAAALGVSLLVLDEDKETGIAAKKPSQFKQKLATWFKSFIP